MNRRLTVAMILVLAGGVLAVAIWPATVRDDTLAAGKLSPVTDDFADPRPQARDEDRARDTSADRQALTLTEDHGADDTRYLEPDGETSHP